MEKKTEAETLKITLCMGSSCFARGNGGNLETIEQLICTAGLNAQVELTGTRCEERCTEGPNILINGRLYKGVTPEILPDILNPMLKGR